MKKNIKRFMIICLCSMLIFNSIFMTTQKEELHATAWVLVLKSGAVIKYATILKGLLATTAVILGYDFVQSNGGLDRMVSHFRSQFGDEHIEENITDNEDGTITYSPLLFSEMSEFFKQQVANGSQIALESTNILPNEVLELMDSNMLSTFESFGSTYFIQHDTSENATFPYRIFDIPTNVYRVYKNETNNYLTLELIDGTIINSMTYITFCHTNTKDYWLSSASTTTSKYTIGEFDKTTSSFAYGSNVYYFYGMASTLEQAKSEDGYIIDTYEDGIACTNGVVVDFADLTGIEAILGENAKENGLTIEMNETIATTIDESTSAKDIIQTIATTTDDITIEEATTNSTVDTSSILNAIVSLPNAIVSSFKNLLTELFIPDKAILHDILAENMKPFENLYSWFYDNFIVLIEKIKNSIGDADEPPKFKISLKNSSLPFAKKMNDEITVIDFSFMEKELFTGMTIHSFYLGFASFILFYFWLRFTLWSLPAMIGGYYKE